MNVSRLIRDIVIFSLSYIIGFLIRFGVPFPYQNWHDFIRIFPYTVLVFILISALLDTYTIPYMPPHEELVSFLTASILTTIIWSTFNYFLYAFALPRSIMLIAIVIQMILIAISQRVMPAKPAPLGVKIPNNFRVEEILQTYSTGKSLILTPDLKEMIIKSARLITVEDSPMLWLPYPPISHAEAFVKRLLDLTIAIPGSIIALILTLFVGPMIWLESPGPIFFTQTRLGKDGKPFKLIKFRTMIPDAEKYTGPTLATEDDPRITRIGKLLRKFRIDEFPQFFNVLLGHMSVVGPRPERPEMYEKISKELPTFRFRLLVKPGITGMAQVYGKYDTDPREKLKYDLMYIFTRPKLALDIKIILLTIKTMLTPERAK